MAIFRIQTHGRLQEWVAEEKGYFTDEGLEYEFVDAGGYGVPTMFLDPAILRRIEQRSGRFSGHRQCGKAPRR